MRETELSVANGPVRLAGTLVEPDEPPRGVVIFVHGSGPMDRNENAGRQHLDVFNSLAAVLAAAGFASIRYDKRGVGGSTGSYKRHGYDDLLADLAAWVAYARARPELGPITLCGHSEGTILAARLAGMAEGDGLAGLMLLCPFVTDGATILRLQAGEGARMIADMPGLGGRIARFAAKLIGGPRRAQERAIAKVLGSEAPVMRLMGRRQGVRWLRDFLSWDFAAIYRALELPSLLLVAGKDVQCPPEDGARIAALSPAATLVTVDDLTHLLRRSDAPAGLAAYREQFSRPIDPVVGAVLTDWLTGPGRDGATRIDAAER